MNRVLFELPDQDGNPVKLSGLRGRPVVVYFYPKASTPGCTMYGRTYFGSERTTFVIGPDGTVVRVLRKVKPYEHDALVLGALHEAVPPSL